MAESSAPSGAEQYCIVKELLDAQSNTEWLYSVSTSWIFRWMDHVAHFDKLLYTPGKLRMQGDNCSTTDEFCNLGGMYPNCNWFGNMWVSETIWCKWIQWYGIDDDHQLDRRTTPGQPRCMKVRISLKGDVGTRVGHTSKVFKEREKCGYIELQLRRIFGVTHDTETQLWVLYGNTRNPLVSDRGKELVHYITLPVRYYIGFLSLVFSRKLM